MEHAILESPIFVGPIVNLVRLHEDAQQPNNVHPTYDGSTGRRAHSMTAVPDVLSLKTRRHPQITSSG